MNKTVGTMMDGVGRRIKGVLILAGIAVVLTFSAEKAKAGTLNITNQTGGTLYFCVYGAGACQFSPTLSAGQTWSAAAGFLNGYVVTVYYGGAPGTLTNTAHPGPLMYTFSDNHWWYASEYVDPTGTNVCTITLCVKNNDSKLRLYGLFKGSTQYTIPSHPGGFAVGAGASSCVSFTDWCTNSTGYYLDLYPGEPGSGGAITNSTVVTNGVASYPSTTNSYTPNSPVFYNPTNAGTASNILWTASSHTNTILSQQQGDSAVHDAINKFAAGNDSNLRNIGTNISRGNTILGQGFNGLSNMVGVLHGLTNGSGGETGVVNAVNQFRNENTNLLGQILNAITIYTNTEGEIEILTNLWTIPEITEHGEFTGQMGDLQALAPDGTLPETDDAFWLVTLIPGVDPFNFRPSHHLGSVATLMRKLILWIVVIAYCLFVLKDIFELFQLVASTAQMDAPEAEATVFGVGGNWGILLAPVVISVFLAAWALLLESVITSMGAVVGTVDFISFLSTSPFAGVTGPVAHGVGEVSLWFPLSFVMSSAVAYVAWYATKNVMAGKMLFILKMIIH